MDRNEADEILAATDELLRALIKANDLEPDDIVSALFTVTRDLDAAFPARAAEEFGWNIVALLHATEIPVPGSLPRCIPRKCRTSTSWPAPTGGMSSREHTTSTGGRSLG